VRAPGVRPEGASKNFLAELRHGWREFSSRSWQVAIIVSLSFSNLIFPGAFLVLGPTVAKESLGGSSSWALIAATWGVGGLLGGLVALNIRPRRPLLVSESAVLLFALPIFFLAIPTATVVITLGALVAGATVSLAEILYETTQAQQIPPEALARVTAYDWLGSLALEPLGLALIGPVAMGLGISTTLWLSAVVLTLLQAAVLAVPSVRRLEAVQGEPTPVPPPRPIEVGD
jgi:hypothetical protein